MSAPLPQYVVTGASSVQAGQVVPGPVYAPPPPAAAAPQPQLQPQAPSARQVTLEGKTFDSPDAAAAYLRQKYPGATVTYTTAGETVKFSISGAKASSTAGHAQVDESVGAQQYSVSFPDPLANGPWVPGAAPGSPGGQPLLTAKGGTPTELASNLQARLGPGSVVTPVYDTGGRFTSLNIQLPQKAEFQAQPQLNPVEAFARTGYGLLVSGFQSLFTAGASAGRYVGTGGRSSAVTLDQGEQERLGIITTGAAYLFPGGAILHGVGTPEEGTGARVLDVVFGGLVFVPALGEAAEGARFALATRLVGSAAGRAVITAGQFLVSPYGRFVVGTGLGTAGGLAYGESPEVALAQGVGTGALFVAPDLFGAARSLPGRAVGMIRADFGLQDYHPFEPRVGGGVINPATGEPAEYVGAAGTGGPRIQNVWDQLRAEAHGGVLPGRETEFVVKTDAGSYYGFKRSPAGPAVPEGGVPTGFPSADFQEAAADARAQLARATGRGGPSYADVFGREGPGYSPEFEEAGRYVQAGPGRALTESTENAVARFTGEYGQAEVGAHPEPIGREPLRARGPMPSGYLRGGKVEPPRALAGAGTGESNKAYFNRLAGVKAAKSAAKTALPEPKAEPEEGPRPEPARKEPRQPEPKESGGGGASEVGGGGGTVTIQETLGQTEREAAAARIAAAKRYQRPQGEGFEYVRYPPGAGLGGAAPRMAEQTFIADLARLPERTPGEGLRAYNLSGLGLGIRSALGLRGGLGEATLTVTAQRQDLGESTLLRDLTEEGTVQVQRTGVLTTQVTTMAEPTVLEEEGRFLDFPVFRDMTERKRRRRGSDAYGYLEHRFPVRIALGGRTSLRRFLD